MLMTKKIAIKEMGTIREMLLANSFQIDALVQLMIEKGLISGQEFLDKLKKAQADFQRRVKAAG
jgi:hypothetical protein